MNGPKLQFISFLREKLGTDKWVVASRLSQRLKARGYSEARFLALRIQFREEHGE